MFRPSWSCVEKYFVYAWNKAWSLVSNCGSFSRMVAISLSSCAESAFSTTEVTLRTPQV